MSQRLNSPLPMVVVCGFLGSGKSSLLSHFAEQYRNLRLLFIVNDFAASGLSHGLQHLEPDRLHELAGGSLFCNCKAGQFVHLLREVIYPAHQENPFDGVIIESSGISDPSSLHSLLDVHGLNDSFRIVDIITVIAPRKFFTLFDNLPLISAQIAASTQIFINKVDSVDEAHLNKVETAIRGFQPSSSLSRCYYCQVNFDLETRLGLTTTIKPHLDSKCETTSPYLSLTLGWQKELSEVELNTWLEQLPEYVLRVKGRVPVGGGQVEINRTVDDCTVTPCTETTSLQLIIIVHRQHEDKLAELMPPHCSPTSIG